MNFSLDGDQRELAATLRRALSARAPVTRWLQDGEAGSDPAWQLIADLQAEAPDVGLDRGGAGLSVVELAITAEELGRVVAPTEFAAGVGFAQSLLIAAGDVAAEQLRESLDGRRLVMGADPSGSWTDLDLADDSTLAGSFRAPIGARNSDMLVALARTAGGGRALVVADLDRRTVAAADGIDPTAGSAVVTLEGEPATVCATDDVDRVEALARRRARIVIAAQALGGARACLDMTATFAQQRQQFGRPIGSFQAVKHRLADLFVETELLASAVYFAACEYGRDAGDLSAATSVELGLATYRRAARDAIQLHGGMGFTWEHPAHIHLRRCELLAALAGPADAIARYDLVRQGDA